MFYKILMYILKNISFTKTDFSDIVVIIAMLIKLILQLIESQCLYQTYNRTKYVGITVNSILFNFFFLY